MIKSFFLIIISIFLIKSNLFSQHRIPSEKPKLIIGIVIEDMAYEYIYRYWDKYSERGFKRLINQGTFCKNTQHNYLFTNTAAGHASISSGSFPMAHGIIGNEWYSTIEEEIIDCTFDDEQKTIGSDSDCGKKSPKHLIAETIGDKLKLSNNKKSKVFSISLDDEPAILSGGHLANAAYWFDNNTGFWISSSYYIENLPLWLNELNAKKFPDIYLEREWNTLLPIEKYTESLADDNQYEKAFENKYKTFPHDIKDLKAKDYEILKFTPYGNTYTKDFAIETIVNEELGEDNFTDFISITFSATKYIAETFGLYSVEIEDTYLRLDKDIAHFLKFIDEYLGKHNVIIYLTSDQGLAPIESFNKNENLPGKYFDSDRANLLLRAYLNAKYGHGEWIKRFMPQQIYLNRNLIEDSNLSMKDFQDDVSRFILQFSGVSSVSNSINLENNATIYSTNSLMKNSFYHKRSGDIIFKLESGWNSGNEFSVSHNYGYKSETHVPLIWYGWKINRSTILQEVSVTDIAPTISSFLNISYPNSCQGRTIIELIK